MNVSLWRELLGTGLSSANNHEELFFVDKNTPSSAVCDLVALKGVNKELVLMSDDGKLSISSGV